MIGFITDEDVMFAANLSCSKYVNNINEPTLLSMMENKLIIDVAGTLLQAPGKLNEVGVMWYDLVNV